MGVRFQATPNPNAGKFVVGKPVVDGGGTKSYYNAAQAAGDPVASALLGIEGVASLFMADDFITVIKQAETDWSALTPRVVAVIEAQLA